MISKENVVQLLTDLLKSEYQQRDVYETYFHYLFGKASPALRDHIKVHIAEEQLHIDILQRYLMGLGASPVVDRNNIPKIEPFSLDAILQHNLESEQAVVKRYSEAIMALEPYVEYVSIRVDLEDILKQEQEHTHDLIQWTESF